MNGEHIASWKVGARGGGELQYTMDWVQSPHGRPLSLSLPFTVDHLPLKGEKVRHYFDNLLPDSEAIRQRIQTRYRTPSNDAFALLAAVGRDCVGAVQLLPPEQDCSGFDRIEGVPLTDEEVERIVARTTGSGPRTEVDLRISIAGAQEKTALLRHGGRWYLPSGATPTTHIFKLPLGLVGGAQADMTGSVENEWLCAQILQACGVPMAKCEIGQFGAQKALIVERFDRQLHSSGRYWLRLVQEDFCQAFALPHSLKYESDGGPGVLEISEVLQSSVNRDADLAAFFKSQVLFWLLAAGDGHAKNFSLRILPRGRYHLTPLYDVLSYWPIIGRGANKWPLQTVRMAMAMAMRGKDKHYFLSEIRRSHLIETAARARVGKGADRLVDEIVAQTPQVIDHVQQCLPKGFPADIADPIFIGLRHQLSKLTERA
jgi:serine/threonine-protein kinase HipA